MTAVLESSVSATTELLDPSTLTVDTNVRKDAGLTPEFVASIKEHGVLVPVVAHRAEDGTVHVQMGQRRALTDGDRADAYHQMSLLGISPTVIARRTGAKKTTVQTALAVKANETAAAALAQGLTLEQSAVIAEFSDNAEEAAKLEKAALENPGNFAHTAQRFRDERATAALIATATAEAEAKGLIVLSENPNGWDYKGPAASIYELTTAEGEKLTVADADAVYLNNGYSGINERLCVADWKARGLRKGGKPAAGGMTEEEKLVRRTTIENNKAADSAEVVRREFLTTLLSRKTAPKDTARFIAYTLTHSSYLVAKGTNYAALTATLLGCGADRGELQKHLAKPTVKPEMVSLAFMITAYEASIDRTSWRHKDDERSYYLKAIAGWGYGLSDVEKLMITT